MCPHKSGWTKKKPRVNVPWTEEWEVEVLVPSNTTFVHEVMLDAFDEDD